MKCIYCDHDTNYRGRKDSRRCAKCSRPFALEPKSDPFKIADKAFQSIVRDVSVHNTLHFTDRQLWYGTERHVRQRLWTRRRFPWIRLRVLLVAPILITVIALGLTAGIRTGEAGAFFFLLVPGIIAASTLTNQAQLYYRIRHDGMLLPFERFRRTYLTPWIHAHGPLPNLVSATYFQPSPPADAEPDLTEYSIERAVITDRADTAAMLIANRVHFEQQCVILSIDGYPEDVAADAQRMLRGAEHAHILALHDASVEGLALASRIREAAWLPVGAAITDLGLSPARARRERLPGPVSGRIVVGRDVVPLVSSAADVEWLASGRTAEVDVYPPRAVMRAVSRGFLDGPRETTGVALGDRDAAERQPSGYTYWGSAGDDSDGSAGGEDSFG